MTIKEKSLEKDNNSALNQTSLDSVCISKAYDHVLGRDCLKIRCTCCKAYDRSMVLEGIEGILLTEA